MLTVSGSADDLFDSLQSGAVGYLLKDVPSSDVPSPSTTPSPAVLLNGVLTVRVLGEFRRG